MKNMKKYIAILALMIACQTGFAQSTKTLFREFGQEERAECISLSPLLMGFARLFMDDDESERMVKKINSIKILDLGECSEQVKSRFLRKVNRLDLQGYERVMQTKEDGEKVQVLLKMQDNAVRELLIISAGKENCSLIQLSGKIRQEDIAGLVEDETNKRKHGRN